MPVDVSPPAGETEREPADEATVRLTGRVVFPLPFVVFMKLTVSV